MCRACEDKERELIDLKSRTEKLERQNKLIKTIAYGVPWRWALGLLFAIFTSVVGFYVENQKQMTVLQSNFNSMATITNSAIRDINKSLDEVKGDVKDLMKRR